jgi:hypothetical protein
MYESKDKMVSHPDHYQSANGLEVIDCIEAFTAGLDGIEATDTGNIIKYACRWKKKNGIQDLEKILWYTQHLIDYLRDKEKESDDCQKVFMLPFGFLIKRDAEEALSKLMDAAKTDGYVTVVDVYDACDLSAECVGIAADSCLGWSYDDIAATEIHVCGGLNTYRLVMPCKPYDIKYKEHKDCKEAESDHISEDHEPAEEDFEKWFMEKWFNSILQQRGYVMEADICVHAKNCKAFDKKEDK